MRKKIIFTSNTSFSLYNFWLGIIRRAKEMNFQVIAVAPEDDYSPLLKKEFFFYPVSYLDRKGTNPFNDIKLFLEFLILYSKIKPDLVINFTIKPNVYSSLACGFLGIPSISVVTGLGYVFVKGGILQNLVSFLYRISFKKNRFVVVLNPQDLRVVSNLAEGSRVILIQEGVNTEYFSPEICKETKVSENTIFLFSGRFLKHKGVIELIQAGKELWKERKDFEVWLLGSIDPGNPASLKEEDLNEIKKLDFVKILPFTKDVKPFICQADCIVLPSYYREGIPRTLLEAMAMEKPIITTDSPGCRETCHDGVNGYLVKPGDLESLRKAMKQFINLSTHKRKEMGKEGRKLVLENFDEKLVVEKYLRLIDQCLGVKG